MDNIVANLVSRAKLTMPFEMNFWAVEMQAKRMAGERDEARREMTSEKKLLPSLCTS